MRSFLGSILFCVLLNVALSIKTGINDWFFKPNFSDGSQHDNDPEREFWRDSGEETTSWIRPEERTETTSEEPNPNKPAEETTTEEPTTEEPTTEEPTSEGTTTEEPKILYYKKRKLEALRCSFRNHTIIRDEFGCQWCNCNNEGVMLCTKFDCGDESFPTYDIDKEHNDLMNNAVNTNQILREYATDCQQGGTVEAGRCTCSCVLPGMLSCPKSCFYSDDVTITTTEEYGTTTAYITEETTTEELTTLPFDFQNG